jgi:hypothetical protein
MSINTFFCTGNCNWNDPNNWTFGYVPDENHTALFETASGITITVDEDYMIGNLEFTDCQNITISGNGSLTVWWGISLDNSAVAGTSLILNGNSSINETNGSALTINIQDQPSSGITVDATSALSVIYTNGNNFQHSFPLSGLTNTSPSSSVSIAGDLEFQFQGSNSGTICLSADGKSVPKSLTFKAINGQTNKIQLHNQQCGPWESAQVTTITLPLTFNTAGSSSTFIVSGLVPSELSIDSNSTVTLFQNTSSLNIENIALDGTLIISPEPTNPVTELNVNLPSFNSLNVNMLRFQSSVPWTVYFSGVYTFFNVDSLSLDCNSTLIITNFPGNRPIPGYYQLNGVLIANDQVKYTAQSC